MNPEVVNALIGVAALGLAAIFPAIPSPCWIAILQAIRNGDIVLADIEAFCAANNITIHYDATDFPSAAPGTATPNNINRGDTNA